MYSAAERVPPVILHGGRKGEGGDLVWSGDFIHPLISDCISGDVGVGKYGNLLGFLM